MKRNTVIFIVLAVIAVIVFAGYNYLYKEARNIQAEEAAYTITANQLLSDYKTDSKAADSKYLNNTITVKGRVTRAENSLVIVDSTIVCQFLKEPVITSKEPVAIKGRCIGYDELFEEVKLDQCNIESK